MEFCHILSGALKLQGRLVELLATSVLTTNNDGRSLWSQLCPIQEHSSEYTRCYHPRGILLLSLLQSPSFSMPNLSWKQ